MQRIILVLILLLAIPTPAWALDNDIEQAMANMSLEQKLGQLFVVFFEGPYVSPELKEMIADHHIGGIILYSITDNVRDPAQVATLTSGAQRAALDAGNPGLIVAVDQEGGPVTRLTHGFTVFPPNMAAAAAGLRAVASMARVTAAELKAVGVNMNFAPVADVNVNPDNPIIGVRAFGSAPEPVSRMAAAAIAEYNRKGVVSCAKHFPGHGDTGFDSHLHLPVVPHGEDRLNTVELAPFRAAIKAEVPAIMTAHVAVPALTHDATLPATMSHDVLTRLLREDMGFDGVIVTDSLGMGALDKRYGIAQSAEMAFMAGADILLFGADKGHTPEDQKTAYKHLLDKLRSGDLPLKRLNQSVTRILRLKQDFGILDPELAVPTRAPRLTGTAAHRHAADNLAKDSITLLRDEHGVLPLEPDAQTVVIRFGPETDMPGDLGQARTVTLPLNPEPDVADKAFAVAARAERVVALVNGARKNPVQARLVQRLMGPGLVIALTGAPYDALAFPGAPCVIACFSDVPASLKALADALYGEFQPSGRLPVELGGQ